MVERWDERGRGEWADCGSEAPCLGPPKFKPETHRSCTIQILVTHVTNYDVISTVKSEASAFFPSHVGTVLTQTHKHILPREK